MPRSLPSMWGELNELPSKHSTKTTLGVTGVFPQSGRSTLVEVGDKMEERRLPSSPGVDGT